MVISLHLWLVRASGSPNATPFVAMTNELESQMLDGKLVLVGGDGRPLRPCKSTISSSEKVVDPDNTNSDDEVLKLYNETATYMASTSSKVNEISKSGGGVGEKILYEQWKEETYDENPYDDDDDDDFDHHGLTEAQLEFANGFDISLHGQIR